MIDGITSAGRLGKLNAETSGAMDTGATTHTSGRAKLFPKKGVEKYSPNIKVQIANGVRCNVLLMGLMLVPVQGRTTVTSSKKQFKCAIGLAHSLLVEQFPVTLISPKAMFRNEGIRCYFNDDLYFKTPGGFYFDFIETDNLYILPFLEDSYLNEIDYSKVYNFSAAWQRISADRLHTRFMRFSLDRIQSSREDITGVDFEVVGPNRLSHNTGNARHHSTRLRVHNPHTYFGSGIASDTIEFETSTPFAFKYMVTFLDLATKYLAGYFLRTHTSEEVRHAFNQFHTDHVRFMRKGRVELWYMDNGSEFGAPKFFSVQSMDQWCSEYWIRRKFIVPWNPQENPAESSNRILLRPIRASFAAANCSTKLWPFSAHQSIIAHNALCTTSDTALHAHVASASHICAWEACANAFAARPVSPYRMVHGHTFDGQYLRALFCACDVLLVNPKDLSQIPKAAPRTLRACHLGLDPRRQGYFVYIFSLERFTTSAYKDTYFGELEDIFPPLTCITGWSHLDSNEAPLPSDDQQRAVSRVHDNSAPAVAPAQDDVNNQRDHIQPSLDQLHGTVSTRTQRGAWHPDHCEVSDCTLPRGHSGPHSNDLVPRAGPPARNLRPRHPVVAGFAKHQPYGYTSLLTDANGLQFVYKTDAYRPIPTPNNTREAFIQDEQGWRESYARDFEAKMQNGAFEFIEDDGTIPRKCIQEIGWAHKIVWNEDNMTIDEKRSRLVGRGYLQVPGRDFCETYSATPRQCAVRGFAAAITCHDMDDVHLDVIKAFTQNKLDVDMFAYQPVGLDHVVGKNGKPMLLKVIMALEGLRQAAHLHQVNHSKTFVDFGWEQQDVEPCLFTFTLAGILLMIALVWTDDVAVGLAKSKEARDMFQTFLTEYGKRWNYKNKGPIKTFVGFDFRRVRGEDAKIWLSLPNHIDGIADKHVPAGTPAPSLPVDSQETLNALRLAADDTEKEQMKTRPYLAALAALLFYVLAIRPDCTVVVVLLCQFMQSPSPQCWDVLVKLIAYCHGTRTASIMYRRKPEKIPKEFDGSAAEWKLFRDNFLFFNYCDGAWKITSVAGYLTSICDGPLVWSTKLVKVICHSSAEAEICAGSLLSKDNMYLRQLLGAMGINILGAVPTFIDSTAAMDITGRLGVSKRTAHFLRWQHYMRWCVSHNFIRLIFVSTKRQLADALTKMVDKTLFLQFRDMVLVIEKTV